MQRITVSEILEDEWFKKDYKPPVFDEKEEANLDDVEAVFQDSEVSELIVQNFIPYIDNLIAFHIIHIML